MDIDPNSKLPAQTDAGPHLATSATTAPAVLKPPITSTPDVKPSSMPPVPAPARTLTSTPKTFTKSKGIPPGYKIVKIRKEDGSIVTVMRKITAEAPEAADRTKSPPSATSPGAGNQVATYKVVTVRDANGALIRVKRLVKAGDAASSPSSTTPTQCAPNTIKPAANTAPTAAGGNVKPDLESSKEEPQQGANTGQPPVANDDKKHTLMIAKQAKQVEPSAVEKPTDMVEALADQHEFHRQRRMHRMKGSLLRGFGVVLGSSIGKIDFDGDDSHYGGRDGGDIQDGDIVDSDQSFSEDDMDDGEGSIEPDGIDSDAHSIQNPADLSSGIHFDAAGAASSTVAAMAARAAVKAPKPAPNPVPKSSEDAKNKETYKVTTTELEAEEKRAIENDLERPLRHHWTNFSFYLMASLSIMLPLFFLLLVVFIFLMNNNFVTSRWKVMEQVVKVGVSAWPIVFAAVIAQVFKAYATWKVERGIKLIQLEQLIGSNSFGSAIKQPMVLRQLDTLTLLLLLTWCLSPFGSQSLQRSYYTVPYITEDQSFVYYLNQTGSNAGVGVNFANNTVAGIAAYNAIAAIYFLSTMTAVDENQDIKASASSNDQYSHPLLYKPVDDYSTETDKRTPISRMGLPIVLPETQIVYNTILDDTAGTIAESFDFNITSSYFDFTCGDWSVLNAAALSSTYPYLRWSSSKTLGLAFNHTQNLTNTRDHVRFASANIDLSNSGNPATEISDSPLWNYSFIECNFTQKFFDAPIRCVRTPPGNNSFSWNVEETCYSDGSEFTSETRQMAHTELRDFSDAWTQIASPRNSHRTGVMSTPTELYVRAGVNNYHLRPMNLSSATRPSDFAVYFGNLFNTWVTVGYCPLCQPITTNETYHAMIDDGTIPPDEYIRVPSLRTYSRNQIYRISTVWIACFTLCTVLLLIAGIVSVVVESLTVAPDTLGYVSSVARNSRYLHVKPTSGAMNGPERARKLADTKVMMQDVKANGNVGKIALGLQSEKAVRLQADRIYR